MTNNSNNNNNNNNSTDNYIIAGGLAWTDEEIEEIYKDIEKQKQNESED